MQDLSQLQMIVSPLSKLDQNRIKNLKAQIKEHKDKARDLSRNLQDTLKEIVQNSKTVNDQLGVDAVDILDNLSTNQNIKLTDEYLILVYEE